MASALGLGSHRFAGALKRSINLSPHAYVTQLRIEHGRRLLRDSSLSISEVALAVGFSSRSHFTAEFRRRVGITPNVYRRRAISASEG
ncbi:MAG: helix-turn-helix transcriptional regulator [Chloroflexi bacterium]|nr:helix-turn-helix transcriptional regulator [Chloroflexota bacterium]